MTTIGHRQSRARLAGHTRPAAARIPIAPVSSTGLVACCNRFGLVCFRFLSVRSVNFRVQAVVPLSMARLLDASWPIRSCVLLVALLALVKSADGRSFFSAQRYHLVNKRPWDTQECEVFKNEPLHAIMDRICEMCHEMFSHEKPNLRAECRAECFGTEKFRTCLQMFSPAAGELPMTPVRRRQVYLKRKK
uniref:Uncharacterized protein n=1 Tax=Plectus sambesii TaxID=2011161 RepID=A0A914WAQ4_9BILA